MNFRTSPGYLLPLALAVVLGVALALRLTNLDWDQGHLFHPDERAIIIKVHELGLPWQSSLAQLVDPATSLWNPRWFPYGSFPLYVLKLAGTAAATFNPSLAVYPDLRLVGRTLSACFDVGTVLLVFLIGSRLYRPVVGLLAAALAAVTVLHVQLSHFATVDVPLTFCVMLALYGAVQVLTGGPSGRNALLTGLGLGLGLATKVSISPLVGTVIAAYVLWACRDEHGNAAIARLADSQRGGRAFRGLLITGAAAAAVFVGAEPFALLDHETFLRDTREQTEMVLRLRDYPYTRQYVATLPYWYPLWQVSVWGLGVPLALAAWAGLLAALRRGLWQHHAADLLLLSWVVPYFLITGAFPVKFLRYMLPIVPVLLIFAARLLLARHGNQSLRHTEPKAMDTNHRWQRLLAQSSVLSPQSFLVGLVLVTTFAYALAYLHIYARPHPAVAASAWITRNVPPGTTLLREHWDEGLPRLEQYPQRDLTLYEPDDARKRDHLITELQQGEYLILFSNRLYGTIPRLPDRYPLSTRYYQALFQGELGYALVYAVGSYPTLGPVSLVHDTFARPALPVPELLQDFRPTPLAINLGYADESFTNYDHPLVLIFQKVEPRTPVELAAALTPPSAEATPPVQDQRLLLSDGDRAAQQAGGTWREMFDPDSVANRMPLVVWLLGVQGLGLLALPFTLRVFRPLPDQGYPFARALGLLLVSYLAWLGASLKLFPYTWQSIALAVLLVGLGSALLAYRSGRELRAVIIPRWRLLALEEVIFLGAILGWYGIRLLNPDLWHPWRGGEKPMDVAYLNAIIRSTWMPPYDPWFAGGYINYYYFGQFLVATLTKLTGILPEVAYNLAIPLFFALLVSGVFSVVYNLTESARRALVAGGRRLAPEGPLLAALAGVLMVAFLGNMDGLLQLLGGLRQAAEWEMKSDIPGVAGVSAVIVGAYKVLFAGALLPEFDFWRSSRMMPPTISITEFPYFTFLFADLHAHLLALPYTVLVLALALNLALGARQWSWWGGLVRLAVLGWTLGALRWMNSWDLPTYFLIAVAAIFIQETVRRFRFSGLTVGVTVLKAGWVLLASAVLWLPFSRSYELFYSGVVPSPETTPLHQYVLVHGLFALLLGAFLIVEALAVLGGSGMVRGITVVSRYWFHLPHALALMDRLTGGQAAITGCIAALSGAALLLALTTALGYPLVGALLLPLGLVGALAVKELQKLSPAGPQRLFMLALVALALAIGIAVELVTLQGDIQRMNTVFKFYLQAWVLFGVAAAFALWWLLAGCWQRPPPGGESLTNGQHGESVRGAPESVRGAPESVRGAPESVRGEPESVRGEPVEPPTAGPSTSSGRAGFSLLARRLPTPAGGSPAARRRSLPALLQPWRVPFLAALAFFVTVGAMYPLAATPVRVRDRFLPLPPTANGFAYLEHAVYQDEPGPLALRWDWEAVQWLRANVDGSPVIVEGVTPIYRWGGRVSILTGLPAVLGWDWHQRQQRWAYQHNIDERRNDVQTLYTSPQVTGTLDILRKYGVQYVYLGELEQRYYPAAGLAKFPALVGQGLSVAYQNPAVTIYRVEPDAD